jgi:hypothetical protein
MATGDTAAGRSAGAVGDADATPLQSKTSTVSRWGNEIEPVT